MAKDFKSTIEEATQKKPRKEYGPEEANNYRGDFKTAGRKGVKIQRMNLAIKPELYEYVRTICRITGRTYAEFVNAVLEKHLQEHGDLYQQALEMRDKLF